MAEPSSSPRSPWRELAALARPQWRLLAAGTAFLAVGSAMGLWVPQRIRALVDTALATQAPAALDQVALGMLAIFAVEALATGLRFLCFTLAGERIVRDLRQRLYGRILARDMAFFDRESVGELLSRVSVDTTALQSAVSVNISMALRSLASVLGGIGLLLVTSPRLTGVMLLVVPVVALGATAFGRRVRGLARRGQEALAAANALAQEALAAVRTVRAFAQEAAEQGRFATAIDATYLLAQQRIRAMAAFSAGASFCAYAALAVVLWVGGRQVLAGQMTVGALMQFVLYTLTVAMALGTLGGLWADAMRALGAGERIFALMVPAPTPTGVGHTLAQVRGEVRLEAVTFAYPSRPARPVLADVSLAIAPGEAVALVGPSGGGKSTVAALLLRLYPPGSGRLCLDGTDLAALDPDWLRRQVGLVAQEPVLFSTSLAENIRYGRPEASDAEVEAAARAAFAHPFIVGLPQGYASTVGERGVQLSGGQRQRVAIARAMLKDPAVLVLDEATSALDAESEHWVQEALEALRARRTTLIVAHRLSTVRAADRIVVLVDGRVVEVGTHTALMAAADGTYRRLVGRQA